MNNRLMQERVYSYQNKKALLLGNGINLLDKEQSLSWGELLADLKREYGISVDLDNVFKPFPLAFEEMLYKKTGYSQLQSKLRNLKTSIRNRIQNQVSNKDGYNEFHQKLVYAKYDDILTTNYDYSLQKSVCSNFMDIKKQLALNKQESKFSLKRRYGMPGYKTKIWHIHGELFDSRILKKNTRYYNEESILIGYDHYTSYFKKIQENIIGKPGFQKPENQSLLKRIENRTIGEFWTDIIFTHNIDILGFGFDFSENHLWWLINQRANYIRNNENKKIRIDNVIRFYFPEIENSQAININDKDFLEMLMLKKNSIAKAKAISEVLMAFNVQPISIQCNSYVDFYNQVLERIKIE